jgi:hypothetical protein
MSSCSFTVTSAKLSANERTLHVNYKEADGDRILPTQLHAAEFERWLQAQPERECPSLIEWILSTPAKELHLRLALYMEDLMWDNHYDAITAQAQYEEQ